MTVLALIWLPCWILTLNSACTTTYPVQGSGSLEPVLGITGHKAGDFLDASPPEDKCPHAISQKFTYCSCMISGLQKETSGNSEETDPNTVRRGKCRKGSPGWDANPQPWSVAAR